jgi:uncharacterized protein YqhQ
MKRGDSVPGDRGGCAAEQHYYGGQAVIEGVMMRGRRFWGLAVRHPDGDIVRRSYVLADPGVRYPLLRWPLVRGVLALWDSLSLGIRALNISANLSLEGTGTEEEPAPQLGVREMAVTVVVALLIGVALFVVAPLLVARLFGDALANPILFNLVEGLVRIAIFLAYILTVSLLPDLRRVFEYHGAEHKVINAYEAGEPLQPSAVQPFSTLHPRCGTAFLLVVMVMAILVLSLVGKPPLVWLIVSRLVGIPIVAGLAYEVIRYAGRHRSGFVARVLLGPGLGLQKLTTRQPSDEQVEVAVAALEEVLRAEAVGEPAVGPGLSPLAEQGA